MVAPLEERVPPPKYGGTELIVYNLTEELVKMGHHVDLYAVGTSITSGNLIAIFPKPVRTDPIFGKNPALRDAAKYLGIARIVENINEKKYDLIHNHLGWRLNVFKTFIKKTPMLTTLHGPLTSPPHQIFLKKMFPDHNYVAISNNQRRPVKKLNYRATVYNGIQIEKFTFESKPGNYLAFLGRMSPEKGPVHAIKIAKAAKMPLIMAAKIDVVDKEYFAKEVKPLIDGKQIKYIGEIGHPQKFRLLKNAKALLATIQWEEPFGLFMIEAMACGTPVVAFRRGAVPEIVKDKITGFIIKDKDIMGAATAIKKLDQISRPACRRHVEKNFTSKIMAENYLKVYKKLLKT